ncbi:MAG: dephospho-CoA kinase [Planctomycetota bacterium]|nr:dephospho-CoA kinase [Planctomycetota bacterium]
MVAKLFGELGCLVIHSDDAVSRAYRDPEILNQLRQWWGDDAFNPDGQINRRVIAAKIFTDPGQRQRLEQLLHPWVARQREQQMALDANNPKFSAFVWDTPLLFEAGLAGNCDAIVYINAPFDLRQQRVSARQGWNRDELIRREKLQWPLDKKQKMSEYVIENTADAEFARGQVRDVLSRILARKLPQQA